MPPLNSAGRKPTFMSTPAAGQPPATRHSPWFVVVVAGFVTCLLAANIVSVKLISLHGLILPAGIVIFPISYIIGDVLTEVYGYAQARRVIWLGFGCNLLLVAAIALAQLLPAAGFWDGQAAFEQIWESQRPPTTKGRWLWTRTIGSTVVAQALDSAVFITLAFAGIIPLGGLVTAIVTQWLAKTAYEALATPLTYLVVGFLKRREQLDVYDRGTRFNPLLVAD